MGREQHFEELRRWLCRQVIPSWLGAEVDDVANEALLALLDAEGVTHERAYLRGVVRNLVAGHCRRQRVQRDGQLWVAPPANPAGSALRSRAYFAIMGLYESDRQCQDAGCAELAAHDFAGESFASIAKRLGISEAAARQRYCRCKKRLKALGQQDPELFVLRSFLD